MGGACALGWLIGISLSITEEVGKGGGGGCRVTESKGTCDKPSPSLFSIAFLLVSVVLLLKEVRSIKKRSTWDAAPGAAGNPNRTFTQSGHFPMIFSTASRISGGPEKKN